MIPNMWYAVEASKSVKKNGILVCKRLNLQLAFYRDEQGELHCVEDLCAHRGASFKDGWVCANQLKCPFHGIEYNAEGKATLIPSEGKSNAANLKRFHLKTYTVYEEDEIIYLWYGDKEPNTKPKAIPEIHGLSYDETQIPWKAFYSRVIENQLDVSHLPFVHHNTIGRGNKTLANGPKVIFKDKNTMIHAANNEVDHGQLPKKMEDAFIGSTYMAFRWPNTWVNHISDKLCILAYFVPVDDTNTLLCLRFYNAFTPLNFLNRLIAKIGSAANRVVQNQDKVIVETQRPKRSTLTGRTENLVQADRPIIEYRKRRAQLIRMATQDKNELNAPVKSKD